MLAQLLAVVGNIPRFQIVHAKVRARELTELFKFSSSCGHSQLRQITKKLVNASDRFRHFPGYGNLGVILIAKQGGQFRTAGEDVTDGSSVVEGEVVPSLIGSPGDVSGIDLLSQRSIVCVRHDRDVARCIECQQKT